MDIQRTARHVAINIVTSICLLLLVIAGNNAQAATRKYVAMPDNSAVLTSNNTAYLSGNNLWKKGDSMTSYIDRLGKRTPVGGIVPKKAFSIPSIATKFKNLAKGNMASIAMSAAISAAIAGVGWVMSDDNTKIQKKVDQTSDGKEVTTGLTINPQSVCQVLPASQALGKSLVTTYGGVTWIVVVVKGGASNLPSGYMNYQNYCTNTSLGYAYEDGYWPASGAKLYSVGDIVSIKSDLTEADLNAFDPWLNQQSAAWISQLLSDMCSGSLKPATCFSELQVAAKELEGPAVVDGGTQTKTSTYTRPDGTMGTRTEAQQTTFELAYGPDYFDYTTKQKTTTTEDGVQTGETTETDGEEVTQEEPKEDQQKDEDEQKEEEPEREASGDECDAPLSCSGDAIDCAVLKQEKALRCAYGAQTDYDKHKDEIKAAVTGDKFEIDDSTEIEIPSFINQGTRFLPSSCPADKSFSLKTGGGRSFVMTYEPLCAAASDLGYLIVIAVGCFCVLYVGRSLGGE